jgi:hypothetical protein
MQRPLLRVSAESAGMIAVRVSSSAATPSLRPRRPPDLLAERSGGGAHTERGGPNTPHERTRIDTTIRAGTSHESSRLWTLGVGEGPYRGAQAAHRTAPPALASWSTTASPRRCWTGSPVGVRWRGEVHRRLRAVDQGEDRSDSHALMGWSGRPMAGDSVAWWRVGTPGYCPPCLPAQPGRGHPVPAVHRPPQCSHVGKARRRAMSRRSAGPAQQLLDARSRDSVRALLRLVVDARMTLRALKGPFNYVVTAR